MQHIIWNYIEKSLLCRLFVSVLIKHREKYIEIHLHRYIDKLDQSHHFWYYGFKILLNTSMIQILVLSNHVSANIPCNLM